MKKIIFATAAAFLSSAAFANTSLPDVSPNAEGQHVVINIPQQRLFLYTDGKLTKIYQVAVGKAITQTNLGSHVIGGKAYKPTWHIPKSIQKERNDGKKTIKYGEPGHPLGPVFVRLGDPKLGLGIHGTNAPSSVPGVRSHGCVRMKSPDALEFADRIATGSPADVIYQMAALNVDSKNQLWLAAYRDPYNKKNLDTTALRKSIAAWAKANGKTVNNKQVDAVLKAKTGALVCVSCGKGKASVAGDLKSVQWTSGSGAYSKAKAMPKVVPSAPAENMDGGVEVNTEAENAPASAVSSVAKKATAAASPAKTASNKNPVAKSDVAKPVATPKNEAASQVSMDNLF